VYIPFHGRGGRDQGTEGSKMINITWTKLARSERAVIGTVECDVWAIGGGKVRYSVLDTVSGEYLDGGYCDTIDMAKEKIDLYV
jgi:hypothetical protein